jgi:hypothetical protein
VPGRDEANSSRKAVAIAVSQQLIATEIEGLTYLRLTRPNGEEDEN